ncbi:hypothetical protein N2152v2_003816 [Parachlorella kessleri]
MWARTVHTTGQLVLPDSLDDDDLQLQVVYDAPEQPQAEDGEIAALRGGVPPAAGSPGQAASRQGGVQPNQLLGSDDVRALLQRTLEAVTQFSPALQLDSERADGAEAANQVASALVPTSNTAVLPQQLLQQPQGRLQQPQQHKNGSGSPSAAAGTIARRPRQPPMHTSPAVPGPAPGPSAQPAAGAVARPNSGGRRWRPQQSGRQAQQDGATSTMRPQQQQQQRAGEQGLKPAAGGAGGIVPSAGIGWGAPLHAPLLCQPAVQQPQTAVTGAVQGQLFAAGALGNEGCEEGDTAAADFFRVDDDLLAAHLRMPPPEAAAAGASTWRAAGKVGRAKQPRQQQQQQQQWQDSRPTQGGALEPSPSQPQGGGGGGGHRNPLATLLDPGGAAGGKGKGGTAKKKPNPIYGGVGGGGGSLVHAPREPLTSPRLHSSKPHFAIREQRPATAPKPSSRPWQQQQPSAAVEGQHESSVHPMQQLLTGREPAGRARLGPNNQANAAGGQDAVPRQAAPAFSAAAQQWHPQQQQQPPQLQVPSKDPPWGDAHTPGRALQGQQHQPSAAPGPGNNDGWGPGPPPTSYKTPGNPLRALFHGGDTPATSASRAGTAGPAATAPPVAEPTREVDAAAVSAMRAVEAGSAGKAAGAAGGGGMSLQRAFVAALAPVSRTAQAQRQRGAGAAGGGLYGRLQALVATEKAQRGQHSAQRAAHARLTVVERENEANLTKCLCGLELVGVEASRMAAAGAAGTEQEGSGPVLHQLARASDSRVVAIFQSRTAREVDLVPGSCVVVPEWALRLIPCTAAGGRLPVLLCLAASQG